MNDPKLLKLFFENAPVSMQSLDENGCFIAVNPNWCKTLGYSNSEVIGKSFIEFICEEDKPLFNERFEMLKKQGSIRNSIFSMILKDGSSMEVSFDGYFYQEPDNGIRHAFCTFKDLSDTRSEQKIQKQALIESEKKAGRLKSIFLENMSHEIRTPMNAILGFSELLLDPTIPSKQKEEFSTLINNNGNILMNLIDDIIDISKIEAGETKIKLTRYKIYKLLPGLHIQFEQRLLQLKRSVELVLDVEEECKTLDVLCDAHRLQQVLGNLLDNAAKFTTEGRITIGLRLIDNGADNRTVSVFIQDTGIGISPDNLNLIFEQFRQVDESPTRKFGGIGLGLYISKRLIELMGGSIQVSSTLGKGSKFEINLNI